MSADDPKAAPSLAERVAERLRVVWDLDKADTTEVRLVVQQLAKAEVAALRAVEAVRDFSVIPKENAYDDHYFDGYRTAVQAIQALLEGKR